MKDFIQEGGKARPAIEYRDGILSLMGQSYPENALLTFGPVFEWLKEALADKSHQSLQVEFRLSYFNTSSTKCIMDLLLMLNDARRQGWDISARWFICDPENESLVEAGEDFRDLVEFDFIIIPFSGAGT